MPFQSIKQRNQICNYTKSKICYNATKNYYQNVNPTPKINFDKNVKYDYKTLKWFNSF